MSHKSPLAGSIPVRDPRPFRRKVTASLQSFFEEASVVPVMEDNYHIEINVETRYLEAQSDPSDDRYVFSYTITIRNIGRVPAQLVSRHWLITDSNGKTQEVRGQGVVGEQPHLQPGQGFRYSSGAVIETPVGSMQGSYQMRADDGLEFDAPIPAFRLAKPGILH